MPTMAEIMSGAVAPTTPGTSMSSYTPGIRDRISGWVQDLAESLGASRGMGQHWGEGSRGLLEANPVTGPFFAADDTSEAIQGGRYKDAAKAGLGLLPLVGPEAKAATAVADAAPAAAPIAAAADTSVAPVMAQAVAPPVAKPPITAYHGSPHSFDKFEWSPNTRSTGEGAQAFGDGLYFAENETVAKTYRDMLKGPDKPPDYALQEAQNWVEDADGNWEKAFNDYVNHTYPDSSPRGDPVAVALENGPIDYNPGSMYQVDIHADPDHFLDWHKPLSEQTPHVQGALGNLGSVRKNQPLLPTDRGSSLYEKQAPGWLDIGSEEAARRLKEAGIPGVTFLDQGSRDLGAGTRNYVVFDDKLVNIVRKYGLAGAVSMGALTPEMARQYQAQQTPQQEGT